MDGPTGAWYTQLSLGGFMEQYLLDQKGLFGVPEFHRIVDKHSWDLLTQMAQATLDRTPLPDLPKGRAHNIQPLSVEDAHRVLDANIVIAALPCSGTVPEAHDGKAHQLNSSWGLMNGRTWYGAYIPVGFTSTLSFQTRNKNISTVCTDWASDAVEDVFEKNPEILTLMKLMLPHDANNIKKIRSAEQKIRNGEWSVETYDPSSQLAAGEGFALFLTHQNLYYTGRNKNSPSLCGALMYPSVAAAERAMKSANILNYMVVKAQLEAVAVVARGPNADVQSALDGAMALQQNKRLTAELETPLNSAKKSKM